MVLLDNGGDALTVSANGSFTFKTALAGGSAYAVTVGTQPAGESCTVGGGSGTVAAANITSVAVSCSATAPSTFTIGGTVTGLTGGASLGLLNNGGDALTVTANGTFVFATPLATGSAYAVTVGTQPAGEICTVSTGSGTVGSANVTNVAVSCSPATASETLFYSFGPSTGTDGQGPDSLILGRDGNFYGTTQSGGTSGTGTVFSLTPSAVETIVFSFGTSTSLVGYAPSSLVEGTDGNFYGITNSGGTYGDGIAFKVASGSETVLHSFGDLDSAGMLDGLFPNGLIQASDGNFYGTTATGNAHPIVFKMTPAGTETVFHGFTRGPSDGGSPLPGLIQASDGNLYGTTSQGGVNDTGVVFKLTLAGVESVLYSFGPTSGGDAQTPTGGLVEGSDGNFYGMTVKGGANGTGTVFKLTPAGVETVLYSFAAPVNGINPTPRGSLIQGTDGNFYGCTQHGGTLNVGTVFKLTPAGVQTLVHSFSAGGTDAAEPGVLLQGSDGAIYGAATSGGANATGAIFRILL